MTDRHRNLSMRYEPMCYVLKELQDAAEFGKDAPYVVQSIACAVANLISAAGKIYGDSGMKRMMDLVSEYGFAPEFYPGQIRVTYVGKPDSKPDPVPMVVEGATEEEWCQEACRIGAYDYVQTYEGVKGRFIRTFTGERTPEKLAQTVNALKEQAKRYDHIEKEGDQGEAAQNIIDCIERIAKPDVSVGVSRMTETGFEDGQPRYTYFVSISRNGNSITPHSYKEEWKAKYEVAEYAEFFGVQGFNWDGTPITESADDILFGDHP